MYESQSNNRGCGCLTGIIVIIVTVFILINSYQAKKKNEHFRSQILEAIRIKQALSFDVSTIPPEGIGEPILSIEMNCYKMKTDSLDNETMQKRIGKYIIVSHLFGKSPGDATETNTVALVEKNAIVVARYSMGGEYLQWIYTVTLINWTSRQVIAQQKFYGKATPPVLKPPAGKSFSDEPKNEQLRAWLHGTRRFKRAEILAQQINSIVKAINKSSNFRPIVSKGICENQWIEMISVNALDKKGNIYAQIIMRIDWDRHRSHMESKREYVEINKNLPELEQVSRDKIREIVRWFNNLITKPRRATEWNIKYRSGVDEKMVENDLGLFNNPSRQFKPGKRYHLLGDVPENLDEFFIDLYSIHEK